MLVYQRVAQAVFNDVFPVFSWVFHLFLYQTRASRASLISSGETWRCREKRWTWRCIRYTMAFRRSSRDPTERRRMEEDLWSKNGKPIISYSISYILVIWLVVWVTWLLFSISYMGCHPSHWLIFLRVVKATEQVNIIYIANIIYIYIQYIYILYIYLFIYLFIYTGWWFGNPKFEILSGWWYSTTIIIERYNGT